MSNTIYLPSAGKGIGGALGEGMSTGIIKGMEKQEKEEKAKRVGAMMQSMANAPDRKAALELAGVMITEGAEDIADVSAVYAHVDRLFPARDDTPVGVEGVDAQNNPVTRFLPRGQTPELNTPGGVEKHFGPGGRVGKPDDEFEFLRPGTSEGPGENVGPTQSLGKFPMNKRPSGAITTQEHTLARQLVQDRASIVAQDMAARRDERSEEYLRLAQEKADALAKEALKGKGAATAAQAADDFRNDLGKLEGAVSKGLGKQLADGTWSFEGENERKIFYQRAEYAASLLEQAHRSGGSRNYLAIAKQAVDKFPGRADLPSEEAPAAAPKPAAKSSVGENLNEAAGKVNRALGLSKAKLPTVKSNADFEKLKPGQEFVDENGKKWRKPKK